MRRSAIFAIALLAASWSMPGAARRTAVDQGPPDADGNSGEPLLAELGGYCDYNGDECDSGTALGYSVQLGSSAAVDSVFVSGNGLLSFGSAYSFANFYPADPDTYDTDHDPFLEIEAGETPALADYGVDLVSPGQDNTLYSDGFSLHPTGFFQGGEVSVAGSGAIHADWYICYAPTANGVCPLTTISTLDLTPVLGGFKGRFGGAMGNDAGFVIGGNYTAVTGDSFFLPAQISGLDLSSAVPEPAGWAMMIGGLGLVGAALRRVQRRSEDRFTARVRAIAAD